MNTWRGCLWKTLCKERLSNYVLWGLIFRFIKFLGRVMQVSEILRSQKSLDWFNLCTITFITLMIYVVSWNCKMKPPIWAKRRLYIIHRIPFLSQSPHYIHHHIYDCFINFFERRWLYSLSTLQDLNYIFISDHKTQV